MLVVHLACLWSWTKSIPLKSACTTECAWRNMIWSPVMFITCTSHSFFSFFWGRSMPNIAVLPLKSLTLLGRYVLTSDLCDSLHLCHTLYFSFLPLPHVLWSISWFVSDWHVSETPLSIMVQADGGGGGGSDDCEIRSVTHEAWCPGLLTALVSSFVGASTAGLWVEEGREWEEEIQIERQIESERQKERERFTIHEAKLQNEL